MSDCTKCVIGVVLATWLTAAMIFLSGWALGSGHYWTAFFAGLVGAVWMSVFGITAYVATL